MENLPHNKNTALRIYIEADSIASTKMSGIGHTTLEIVRELDRLCEKDNQLVVTLILPYGTAATTDSYKFKNIGRKYLPRGQRYINTLLVKTGLPLPVDLFFGRGVYIFPNYKTWWTPFSNSITFVHDVVFLAHPETVQPINLIYLQKHFERWLQRATKIITISQATADELCRFLPAYKKKIAVVPLGVDLNYFKPQPKSLIVAAQKKYNLPSEYLLYVGNLEPRKNIGTLLAAYQLYADAEDSCLPLVLVSGGGWKNESTLEQIANMQTAGYRISLPAEYVLDDDLPAIYSGARALVHVAIHEGFGLPPLQAQACGVTLIVSDLAVIKEVVNASHAHFVNPKVISEIAVAMKAVTHESPITSSYKTKLTWSSTVQQLLSISRILSKNNEVT